MSRYSSKRSTKSIIIRTIKRPVKKVLGKIAYNNNYFKLAYRKFRVTRREKRFEKFNNLPVNKKMVIFEAFMGLKYADSPKAIYEYMISCPDYKDFTFVWCFKDRCMDEFLFLEENKQTVLVLWGSDEYYRYYAQAKYWFTNSRLLTSIQPKDEQVYVQCWHGTPLKRLGFDLTTTAEDARNDAETVKVMYEKDAVRYTYMISPSAYCSEKFTSAFNLKQIGKDNIMIEEGYPRNDAIVNATEEDADRIKKQLNIPESKKVILYAPTWRENQHEFGTGYVFESPLDFDRLKEQFGDEYVILFRAHYFISNSFDFEKYHDFVIDVSTYSEINDLYIISDILITDYSSVFFDYGVLKRPVIFYMYDLHYYKDDLRGFYLSLDELPGPIIETQEQLEKSLMSVEEWSNSKEYHEKYDVFTNKFTYLDDGHAAERVTKRIIRTDIEKEDNNG